MTVKKLLQPRWEVIADYPDSAFEMGGIEDRDWTRYVNGEDESDGIIWQISQYPHLFKPLEWWEKRKIEELPDYVMYSGKVYKVTEKYEASVKCEKHPSDGIGLDVSWSVCIPSTEEDYLIAVQ